MTNNKTIFVHIENNEVVGVSSNPRIALGFVTKGANRTVKEFKVENLRHGKNGLVKKTGRKAAPKEQTGLAKKRGRPKKA